MTALVDDLAALLDEAEPVVLRARSLLIANERAVRAVGAVLEERFAGEVPADIDDRLVDDLAEATDAGRVWELLHQLAVLADPDGPIVAARAAASA